MALYPKGAEGLSPGQADVPAATGRVDQAT